MVKVPKTKEPGGLKPNIQIFAEDHIKNDTLQKLKSLIKNGELKGKNIISAIDENTQVIFRSDVGKNAHPIKSKGYYEPINHYNIEIQIKTQANKWKSKWSYHIILDNLGNIVNIFD